MNRLTTASQGGSWAVQGLLHSRRAALVACGIAALVLVGQTARVLVAHAHERSMLERVRAEAALDLVPGQGDAGTTGASLSGGSPSPIAKTVPAEGQPGPLLADLFRLLSSAGIETYRYRLLSPEPSEPEGSVLQSPVEDQPIGDFVAGDGRETWEGKDLVPLELEGAEIPAPPAGIRKWELALSVRASYRQILHLLRLAEVDERIWDVPRISMRRIPGGTETDLRLVTYTRERPGRALETFSIPAPANPATVLRDPFGPGESGRRGSSLVPPRLGAIRLGAGAAAWLDGGPVRPGERVGSWTLLSVAPGEVWVRHDYGTKLRLRLDTPPRKEPPDEQL